MVALAQAMYDETGPAGKHRYTVAEIAAEFGVTRPTIYDTSPNRTGSADSDAYQPDHDRFHR
jgi:hypothetical protein